MKDSAKRVAENVIAAIILALLTFLFVRFSATLWPNLLSHHGGSALASIGYLVGSVTLSVTLAACVFGILVLSFDRDPLGQEGEKVWLSFLARLPLLLVLFVMLCQVIQSLWYQLTHRKYVDLGMDWVDSMLMGLYNKMAHLNQFHFGGHWSLTWTIFLGVAVLFCIAWWWGFKHLRQAATKDSGEGAVQIAVGLIILVPAVASAQFIVWLLVSPIKGGDPWLMPILDVLTSTS